MEDVTKKLEQNYLSISSIDVQFRASVINHSEGWEKTETKIRCVSDFRNLKVEFSYFDSTIDGGRWMQEDTLFLDKIRYDIARHPDTTTHRNQQHLLIIADLQHPATGANWYLERCFFACTEKQQHERTSTNYWLPYAIRNYESEYYLRINEESVNGLRCVVLERPSIDRLWLCPDLEHALVRREYQDNNKYNLEETDFFNHIKVQNMWLPTRIVRKLRGTPTWEANEWDRNVQNADLEIIADKLAVNSVAKSDFELKLPTGTQVHDAVRNVDYTANANVTSQLKSCRLDP